MSVLATIQKQIAAAKKDLRDYRPPAVDWSARANDAADLFVPWLLKIAPELKTYVQDVLNAPTLIRSMWATFRTTVNLPTSGLAEFERLLALDEVLRESVTGETVSNVVTRYLLEHATPLELDKNSRSDYPDVYIATPDYYRDLPSFTRKATGKQAAIYGAALKGKAKRPVRVPDGLEIKTCRDRVAVDCHFPHAGLHLVVLFAESNRDYAVTDILLAFLNLADYREAKRNTAATTVKYSFGGTQFVSVLK